MSYLKLSSLFNTRNERPVISATCVGPPSCTTQLSPRGDNILLRQSAGPEQQEETAYYLPGQEAALEQLLEDCELRGGQTAFFMAKQMLNHGGDPTSWMQGFIREHSLTQRDRTYHELQTLVETIRLAATYDA